MVLGRLTSLMLVSLALLAGSARAEDPISLALTPIAMPAFPGMAPVAAPRPVLIGSSVVSSTQAVAINEIGPVNTLASGTGAVAITTITALNTNVVTNVNAQTNVVIGLGR